MYLWSRGKGSTGPLRGQLNWRLCTALKEGPAQHVGHEPRGEGERLLPQCAPSCHGIKQEVPTTLNPTQLAEREPDLHWKVLGLKTQDA